jgi:uncharacterized protein YndB with AHSA1/START domain
MKIHDSIDVAAPAEAVWPLLADPACMAQWHKRLVSVGRTAIGPVRTGERFATTYTLSGRQRDAEAEVVRCQPPIALTLRHHMRHKGRAMSVDESYELVPDGDVTHVHHRVDFRHAGLPLWACALMWFISRFGYPVEESLMAPLKREVEARPIGR